MDRTRIEDRLVTHNLRNIPHSENVISDQEESEDDDVALNAAKLNISTESNTTRRQFMTESGILLLALTRQRWNNIFEKIPESRLQLLGQAIAAFVNFTVEYTLQKYSSAEAASTNFIVFDGEDESFESDFIIGVVKWLRLKGFRVLHLNTSSVNLIENYSSTVVIDVARDNEKLKHVLQNFLCTTQNYQSIRMISVETASVNIPPLLKDHTVITLGWPKTYTGANKSGEVVQLDIGLDSSLFVAKDQESKPFLEQWRRLKVK